MLSLPLNTYRSLHLSEVRDAQAVLGCHHLLGLLDLLSLSKLNKEKKISLFVRYAMFDSELIMNYVSHLLSSDAFIETSQTELKLKLTSETMSINEIGKLCLDLKQGVLTKASIVDRFRLVKTGLKTSAISPVITLVNLDRSHFYNLILSSKEHLSPMYPHRVKIK